MNRAAAPSGRGSNATPLLIAVDVVVAAVAGIIAVLTMLLGPGAGSTLADAALVSVALILATAMAVRRKWPLAALVTALAGLLLTSFSESAIGFLAVHYTLYIVATRQLWWVSGLACAACLLVAPVGILLSHHSDPDSLGLISFGLNIVGATISVLATWIVGLVIRDRREFAARRARELAGRAVMEERLRIARELHDVVAHSMSLIAVKASVANHVAKARPEEVGDALGVIETTSKAALAEMRRTLGVLRTDSSDSMELTPVPGTAALAGLVDQVRAAGVAVELTLTGEESMPETLRTAVYRIVQEALTNVIKHVGPTTCRVTIAASETEMRLEIADDGPTTDRTTTSVPSGGHGMIGMRERVMMYNGAFHAGPGPHGGFVVSAVLPLAGERP